MLLTLVTLRILHILCIFAYATHIYVLTTSLFYALQIHELAHTKYIYALV